MYYQLELARSGEALFKVRNKYLKYIGIPGVVFAYFNLATGSIGSDRANLVCFCAAFGVAFSGALLRLGSSTYDNIS
jgi:hypothetical protein